MTFDGNIASDHRPSSETKIDKITPHQLEQLGTHIVTRDNNKLTLQTQGNPIWQVKADLQAIKKGTITIQDIQSSSNYRISNYDYEVRPDITLEFINDIITYLHNSFNMSWEDMRTMKVLEALSKIRDQQYVQEFLSDIRYLTTDQVSDLIRDMKSGTDASELPYATKKANKIAITKVTSILNLSLNKSGDTLFGEISDAVFNK